MMAKSIKSILVLLVLATLCSSAYAQSVTRELRRMKGYTIVDVASVSKVVENSGEKFVTLDNGLVFKVDFLLLDPLSFTDVIIFAKPLPPDMRKQYADKLPEAMLSSYKLLIDRDVYDATPYLTKR